MTPKKAVETAQSKSLEKQYLWLTHYLKNMRPTLLTLTLTAQELTCAILKEE